MADDATTTPQALVFDGTYVRLLKTYCSLESRERNVLVTIAERLLVGQKLHGPLYRGKKKWLKELKEEAMDGLVYIASSIEDEKEE
jgi:hypothetical protein